MVSILLAIKYWKLRYVLLPYIMLLYLIRLQYSINITFICIEKQKNSYNLLYFDIHIVEVIWSQIQNIFEACLYTEQMSHIYTHYNLPACREWHI